MDYEAIGLKAGLEIHQQLNTKEKLFCHSPTVVRDSAEHTEEITDISGSQRPRWATWIVRQKKS